MSLAPIELAILAEDGPDGPRRTMELVNSGIGDTPNIYIHFDFPGLSQIPPPSVLDGFVLGILFLAMRQGRSIRVHGPVTRTLCQNIVEFQSAWSVWRPDRYRIVDLNPDRIIDDSAGKSPARAISAFSGGVDGMFTAIRHANKMLGIGSYPLTDVLLVHGFDVKYDDQDAFDRLRARISPVVEDLGLRMHILRTNLKAITTYHQDWEDSFGAQMACALHNFSHRNQFALFGSSEPYTKIYYPWGSTPVTDYLLSGGEMKFVLDGSAFSRTEKCELLARYPRVLEALKVCWEGKDSARNCGRCEKCVRTKLNFLAVGIEEPPCFDQKFEFDEFKRIDLRNSAQLQELESILQFAVNRGIKLPWVLQIKKKLWRHQLKSSIRRMLRRRR